MDEGEAQLCADCSPEGSTYCFWFARGGLHTEPRSYATHCKILPTALEIVWGGGLVILPCGQATWEPHPRLAKNSSFVKTFQFSIRMKIERSCSKQFGILLLGKGPQAPLCWASPKPNELVLLGGQGLLMLGFAQAKVRMPAANNEGWGSSLGLFIFWGKCPPGPLIIGIASQTLLAYARKLSGGPYRGFAVVEYARGCC